MSVKAPAIVYLASQSPRRRQLLDQLGIPHETLLADGSEDAEALEAVRQGEAPATYVVRVTGLKLDAAVARHRARGLVPAPILCADTTVALGRRIFGKPADAAHAARMLRALSGREHLVTSAFALRVGDALITRAVTTKVRFRALSDAEILGYVATGEPMDKAGAYGIQGVGGFLVATIDGSYSNVVGLPLAELLDELTRLGLPAPFTMEAKTS